MSETSREMIQRLGDRHRLDQLFAAMSAVKDDTKDRDFEKLVKEYRRTQQESAVATVDNDEATRQQMRQQAIATSRQSGEIINFSSQAQVDSVADTICELSETYDQDPNDFIALPTSLFNRNRKTIDYEAVFVTLGSSAGLVLNSLADLTELRKQHLSRDTGAYATEERLYQLYATHPENTYTHATILTGETIQLDKIPVMDYTDQGIHIAAAQIITFSSQNISFRPGLIVDSAGAVH